MDPLQALIGGWGAVLSSILAIDQLRQRRRGRVFLTAEWVPESDELHIEVVNIGTRPISIGDVDLAYGETPKAAALLLVVSHDSLRLADGERQGWVVRRSDIVDSRERSKAQIGRSNLLWLRAHLFGAGRKSASAVIDAKAIGASGLYKPAEDSIAADLFVGFPRQEVLAQRRNLPYKTLR